MNTRRTPPTTTKKTVEDHHRRFGGASLACIEQLAGINPQNHAERVALWGEFRHLFSLPHDEVLTAVMAECKRRTARRVNAGELSLWGPWMSAAQGVAA